MRTNIAGNTTTAWQIIPKTSTSKGHFFSGHSTLTNRPDAKTQLSLILLRISSCFFECFV